MARQFAGHDRAGALQPMSSTPRRHPAPPSQPDEVAPPFRDRFLIVDDFLPLELAEAMRKGIDDHFADPGAHAPQTHQVWNYWFVPELYAYLRTQPEKVIDRPLVDQFQARLAAWSNETLGMAGITWPYLSLYVAGCRQGLHNDSVNGRFGFVYSLTRNERRTSGGETIVHHEGDPFRSQLTRPGAGRSFYDAIPPRFNRLVIFDDRMPHAVERVDGSMDPREGRFVLHGHISEGEGAVTGALAAEAAMPLAVEALRAFVQTAPAPLDAYHGPLTIRLEIAADGRVALCRVLMDRVIHPNEHDPQWAPLVEALLGRLRALRFPEADGPSRLTLPLLFGAPLPER
jgi:hypothetical protein